MRWMSILAILFSTVAVIVVTCFFDWRKQFDFDLRYYEISCSHEGIDPFKVWDRQVEAEHYVGWNRPDCPDMPKSENQHYVHAYPPWQTTFFYWYAWVPHDLMSAIVRVANITMFFVILLCLFYYCKPLGESKRFLIVASLGAYFFYDAIQITILGNYGILIAFLLLIFYWALHKGLEKTAGVIWALTMIKPQLTLLIFWPLFVQKRYKIIFFAMMICFMSVLWPAYIYGDSPWNLILEVPKLGAPYVGSESVYSPPAMILFEYIFGKNNAVYALALFCFSLCGVLCYMTRNCKDWWMRALPAMVMIPYWTYTQEMDQIVTWNVVLALLFVAIGRFRCVSRRHSRIVVVMWSLLLLVHLSYVLVRIIVSSRIGDGLLKLYLVQDGLADVFGVMRFAISVMAVVVACKISSCNRALCQ